MNFLHIFNKSNDFFFNLHLKLICVSLPLYWQKKRKKHCKMIAKFTREVKKMEKK